MTRHRVDLDGGAKRDLRGIRDARLLGQLQRAILALGDDPRPPGVKKLAGREDQWRIRVREWRIVYVIEDGRLVVLVVSVAKRDEVYR